MGTLPAVDIESLYARIRAFVAGRVGSAADADEITQDIFLKMHESLPRLKDRDKLVPWLYRIARNRIIDHYRTRKIEVPPGEIAGADPAPVDRDSETGDREAIQACLLYFLETLEAADRDILTRIEFERRTQQEAAKELGITLAAAKSRHQRAKKRLRQALDSCCTYVFDRRGRVIDHLPQNQSCGGNS
ncbi:putative RNA polymerase sigma factor SigZ [Nitrospina gracilis 3/211]|uniref:Putative RNA polymerase sigma factor SigZ n=1 Tax=Nitrospina gracilis (strain 3/211) TaxID=1266370 RepID=M1YWF9_NITG3|nr:MULTISPECIES: sigma-70 family RNA polymerase sigma factor [Nitrospina]MCF8722681.1 RNA polymerase sigma-70 factor (ECF subfamily) [Nitrospina sp. Nb-3]CCQ89622.1 putative RNA polymerase sigma factor SigZ [Nitrospina gracilis 3/211]